MTTNSLPPIVRERIATASALLAERQPLGRFPAIRLAYHRVMAVFLGAVGMYRRALRHNRKWVLIESRMRRK